ncbi:hypothetical protein GCM10027612_88010 [Microbispora bryophytorum subsp. camponoti]
MVGEDGAGSPLQEVTLGEVGQGLPGLLERGRPPCGDGRDGAGVDREQPQERRLQGGFAVGWPYRGGGVGLAVLGDPGPDT